MQVDLLGPAEFTAAIPRLGEILADAVAAGAGVSFLLPFSPQNGEAYWRGLSDAVAIGDQTIFVARDSHEISGTVILGRAWAPNQPHRCEVAKLLVHRDYRRRGVGTLLMTALERQARAMGFTLITFDAVAHGLVEAFYRNLGFTCAGYIPGYAFSTGDKPDGTAIFYKQL
jgi:GNAT superfamily N-acetyltransferase